MATTCVTPRQTTNRATTRFGNTGVGNKQGDYTELQFQATDGNSYSDTKVITVDIHPVADVPVVTVGAFGAVPTGLVIQTWTGGTLRTDLGTQR